MKYVLKVGFSIAAACAFAPEQPAAQTEGNPRFRYDTCLERMEYDPGAAYEIGQSWTQQGGGSQAQHCAALALVELGDYTEAARLLMEIAQSATDLSGEAMRATLLSQAGNAWLLAGNGDAAHRAFSAAINIRLTDAQIYFDRARASAQKLDFRAAEADLTRALSFRSDWPEAHLLRATARRHLGRIDTAFTDITQVLRREPENIQALLEQGLLHQITGNDQAARANWLRAMDLTKNKADSNKSPDDAADTIEAAQHYLETLDVTQEDN